MWENWIKMDCSIWHKHTYFVFCAHILLNICMNERFTNGTQVITKVNSNLSPKVLCGYNDKDHEIVAIGAYLQFGQGKKVFGSTTWTFILSKIILKSICWEERCYYWFDILPCSLLRIVKHSSLCLGLTWHHSILLAQ